MPADAWIALAQREEHVARALEIIGQEDVRWTDLYHLLEVVEADVGQLMFERGWATRAEMERFARTANSPAILGAAARHGAQRTEPPPNPMSYDDARSLIVRLVRAWLEWKTGEGA